MTDSDIQRTIADDDVEWSYQQTMENGQRITPREKVVFDKEAALALLLINKVVFLNDHWWEDEWPDRAKKVTSLNVNCNDVFAWGCADAEEMPHSELEAVYRMWRKDPAWGTAIWCMIQRNQMPQKPVEDIIRKAGIWELDKLGLGKNTQDAECQAYLAMMVANATPSLTTQDRQ